MFKYSGSYTKKFLNNLMEENPLFKKFFTTMWAENFQQNLNSHVQSCLSNPGHPIDPELFESVRAFPVAFSYFQMQQTIAENTKTKNRVKI